MTRLTEQEQQEIVRYIEADKPLPDKFRFLLFEGKREVELVWNGKTSEVCNIVLPFQVIEQVDEPRVEKPRMDANTRESEEDIGVHRRLKTSFLSLIFGAASSTGIDQRLSRMRAGAAQAGGQSGGHLRQRHHDHRRC